MDLNSKLVTQLPIDKLWTDNEFVDFKRENNLIIFEIRELIIEPIQFVIADIGHKLTWTRKSDCYEIWKKEIQNHIANNADKIELDNFPDNYAHVASKWTDIKGTQIILLEKIH